MNVWDYLGVQGPGTPAATMLAAVEALWDSYELTIEEKRALLVTSHGLRAREAAEMLDVTEDHLRNNLRQASRKLGTTSQGHAVAMALRLGIIP